MSEAALRYIALGDSYTIGTGASHPSRNFPNQLAYRLEVATGRGVEVRNPAVHGYKTEDLIREELPELANFRPDVATVLIGVNDLVEDADQLEYRSKLRQIYAEIAQYVKPAMVAAISIPDFSIAPAAARFGSPDDLRSRVEAFNAVASQEAASAGFRYVDLVAASRSEPSRAGWFASDQLHPGDGQYAAWTAWIWECLKDLWPAVARGR